MKMRIKGNSLRLRVSRSEVTRLLKQERLEETIHFAPEAGATLIYALEQSPAVDAPTTRYSNNSVTVLVPIGQARTWCITDQVGIEKDITLGRFGTLHLLIEKDFACLDRSDEENEDTFANLGADPVCRMPAIRFETRLYK
ncbi:MAG: hypothetical protein WBE76_03840 [Terracidiphilus sp.]